MSLILLLQNVTNIRQRTIIPITLQLKCVRSHSSIKKSRNIGNRSDIDKSLQKSSSQSKSAIVRLLGAKIKENTKTASYAAIVLAGLSVTGIILYAIFRELFSNESPNNIYYNALDRVKDDSRVQDAIGAPIKGFGGISRRGRRQHVAYTIFERNGVPYLRMRFYVQGLRNKATVHLESRSVPNGNLEYRYLFVQLDHYPRTTIIIEDNRALDQAFITGQMPLGALELASYTKK